MPLHLDYRPKDFDEIIGNTNLVESLKAIFDRESDYPHSWLLQGATGCGKTTLGRIIADKLGCKGSDFIEINASSSRGIDTARSIVENMKYKPQVKGSKSRVFLIDEVHQITGDAANALLKALEEPPEHVYFILCTTDPDKLLKPIRNRCSTFEVQPLSNRQIKQLLNWVLKQEGVDDIPDNTLSMIAEVVDGCPRQALVMLDQIIDMPLDKMEDSIKDFRSAEKNIFDLTNALLDKKNWDVIRKILGEMDLSNPENIRLAIIGIMAKRVMKGECVTASLVYDVFEKPFYNVGKNGLIMSCNKICMMWD